MPLAILSDIKASLTANKKKAKRIIKKNKTRIISGFLALFFIILSVLLLVIARTRAINAAKEAFSESYDAQKSKTYQDYYDFAYSYNEEKYHVSNKASISVGSLTEEARLEVLSVSCTAIFTKEDDRNKGKPLFSFSRKVDNYCIIVPGEGIYTVNLRGAEFIIDEEGESVIVRVPYPVLAENDVTLIEAGIDAVAFDSNGKYIEGQELGVSITSEAQQRVYNQMISNQDYYEAAIENTRSILTNMIKNINYTTHPKLKVLVEFF